jgi:WD40 repeat protein
MVRMKRRTIVAMGGDYGSLLVAIFAQRFYAQGEDPFMSHDERKECSSKTSPRKLQKRATPSMSSFFSGAVAGSPKSKSINEGESPTSISLEPVMDVSRRLDFLSREVEDEESATDAELSTLLGLRRGELMPNVAKAARPIDVFLKRFDKMFCTHSILTEVVEIETAGNVNGVSISSDGRVVAAGGQGNQVIILETNYSSDYSDKRCEVVQRFKLGDKVFGVSLSEDGSKVAVGGEDKNVMVLDVKTGCELFQVLADDRVRTVALSRKAHVIGFGGFDQSVKLCNTQRGVNMRAFPATDVVRGVSLSQDGRLLAICGDSKRLEVFQTDSQECLQSWEHASKIWVVALSGDGRYVAAGDYSEKVMLRDVESGNTVFEHKFIKAGPPAFVWAIALSEDGSTLSAGSWNQEICVWRNASLAESTVATRNSDTMSSPLPPVITSRGSPCNEIGDSDANDVTKASAWTLFSTAKKGDRVFSIALAENGNLLGCGDRSGVATVHRLKGPDAESELLLETKFPDRVFAVALSSDGTLFAVAGVHKEVWLYNVATGHRVHVFHIAAAVGEGQCVAFSVLPGGSNTPKLYTLGVGGEDKCVTIFECFGEFKRVLKLTRSRDINSLAFSQDMVAVAAGSRVVITGGCGGHQYSWRDRPDFEHMADLLDGDPVALSVVLGRFPSSINLCHPHSGESLMQRAVRLHTNDVLRKVLSVNGSKIGFVVDKSRRTALLMALLLEKRDATSMLIETVASGRVSTMPSSLGAVTECFSLMCKVFPNLLLDLICQTDLEKEPEMIAQDGAASGSHATFARLTDGESMVRGSSKQTGPSWLWNDVCDDSESITIDPIETGILGGNETVRTSSSEDVYRKYATNFGDDSSYLSTNEDQPKTQKSSMTRLFSKDNFGSFDMKLSPLVRRRMSETWETTVAAAIRSSMNAAPILERQSSSLSSEAKSLEHASQDSESHRRANPTVSETKTRQVMSFFIHESQQNTSRCV